MTGHQIYLLLHVLGAIFWVGTGVGMAVLAGRVAAAGVPERMLEFARDSEWLGLRVFLPSNLLVLASGVLLVHEDAWGYDPLWIRLGVADFALSFVTGAAVFGPQWPRLVELAETEGIAAPQARQRLRRLLFASYVDLGVLLAVVTAMTLKPGPSDRAALALVAALPVAGAVAGLLVARLATGRIRAPAAAVGVS